MNRVIIIPRFVNIHRYFFISGFLIPFRIGGWSNFHFLLRRFSDLFPFIMLDCTRPFKAFDSELIFAELPRRHHWTWNDIIVIEASTWKGTSNLPIWFFIFKWINGQDRKYFDEKKVLLGHKHDSACCWQFWQFAVLGVGCWVNLLKHQNVNTF